MRDNIVNYTIIEQSENKLSGKMTENKGFCCPKVLELSAKLVYSIRIITKRKKL